MTKPFMNFSQDYFDDRISPLNTEFGVRYMLNEYFGLKMNFAYNQFKSPTDSKPFKTDEYRTSLLGVINAGRLLKFEHWTKRFNLLASGGIGVGTLRYHEPTYSTNWDDVLNLEAALTGQFLISDRFCLNLRVNAVSNFIQNHAFDGGDANNQKLGMVINGTVGLSYYLGRKKAHADWYLREDHMIRSFQEMHNKLDNKVETISVQDSLLKSKIEHLEKELATTTLQLTEARKEAAEMQNHPLEDKLTEALIKNGYTNIYIKTNSSNIDQSSLGTIQFIANYLIEKPESSLILEGYADDTGETGYNLKLSEQRAQRVKQYLSELGISADRVSIQAKGEESIGRKGSAITRSFARRVSAVIVFPSR